MRPLEKSVGMRSILRMQRKKLLLQKMVDEARPENKVNSTEIPEMEQDKGISPRAASRDGPC
jgi:hypothetical protein